MISLDRQIPSMVNKIGVVASTTQQNIDTWTTNEAIVSRPAD
jgi:hypothetical protein